MQITVLRNLGSGLPNLKEGETCEVDDETGAYLCRRGLAVAVPQKRTLRAVPEAPDLKGIPEPVVETAPAGPEDDEPKRRSRKKDNAGE